MPRQTKLETVPMLLIVALLFCSYKSRADEIEVFELLDSIEGKTITPSQQQAIDRVRASIFDSWEAGAGPDEPPPPPPPPPGPIHIAPGAGPTNDRGGGPASTVTAKVQVVNGPANIRAGPSTDQPRIMLVPMGFELEVIAEVGDWYQVLLPGRYGYIYRELVEEIHSLQAESAVAPGTGEPREVQDLSAASQAFAREFEGPWSFACLDQHKDCQTRHAWYDCDLVMLSCIGESWLKAF
jgi:Bacterial SH3 domain